jgi:hypothetical protein
VSGVLVLVTRARGRRHRNFVAGNPVTGRCHSVLVTGPCHSLCLGSLSRSLFQGPCHGTVSWDFARGTLPEGPCNRDLATETLPLGPCHSKPCHGGLVTGFLPEGPCQRDLARGTLPLGPRPGNLSRGPCLGTLRDLVTGTLSPQGPCHRGLAEGLCHRKLVTGTCHGDFCHGDFVTWTVLHRVLVTGAFSRGPCPGVAVTGPCHGALSRGPRNRDLVTGTLSQRRSLTGT